MHGDGRQLLSASIEKMKPISLFVTGTDTGVGKTLVTALLVLHLRARGVDAGVMKPIASGCRLENGELKSDDALFLRLATGVEDDLALLNPVRYEEPLAPLVAARREAKSGAGAFRDDFRTCLVAYEELRRRHECVVVEGVGGLMAPLQQRSENAPIQNNVDLIHAFGLPTVCVTRRTLGAINHTLLTCSARLQAPARFAALVFCDSVAVEPDDIAAQTNPDLLREITGLPVWGQIPFLHDLSPSNLREIASRSIHIDGLD